MAELFLSVSRIMYPNCEDRSKLLANAASLYPINFTLDGSSCGNLMHALLLVAYLIAALRRWKCAGAFSEKRCPVICASCEISKLEIGAGIGEPGEAHSHGS